MTLKLWMAAFPKSVPPHVLDSHSSFFLSSSLRTSFRFRSSLCLFLRTVVDKSYKILPIALWPWGRLSLQQKWIPVVFPGGKGGRCVRLTTLTLPVPLSWNLGTLTSWNTLGHSRTVMGLLYLLIVKNTCFVTDFESPSGLHSLTSAFIEAKW